MSKYKILITLVLLLSLLFLYFRVADKTFDKHLKLGLSLPQSGIMHNWGDAVYAGANSYFRYANEQKLLAQPIELITLDDKYEPELTLENLKLLQRQDIFAFFRPPPRVLHFHPIKNHLDASACLGDGLQRTFARDRGLGP